VVTIIDNLWLNPEERGWFEQMLESHPINHPMIDLEHYYWVDMAEISKRVVSQISKGDIIVPVITGGFEAVMDWIDYFSKPFLFKSNNLPRTMEFVSNEAYMSVLQKPFQHHFVELERLKDFLGDDHGSIKVIEGDVSTSGLSVARLYAIAKSFPKVELIVGAAPQGDLFNYFLNCSLMQFSFDTIVPRLTHDVTGINHQVLFQCEDPYIRRATELFGVNDLQGLSEDAACLRKALLGFGYKSQEVEERVNHYKHLCLKRINRVNEVSERLTRYQ